MLFPEKVWITTSAYCTEEKQWFQNVLDAGIEREKLIPRNRVKRKMKQWGAWILLRDCRATKIAAIGKGAPQTLPS
jgi:hypothetical protein